MCVCVKDDGRRDLGGKTNCPISSAQALLTILYHLDPDARKSSRKFEKKNSKNNEQSSIVFNKTS